MSHFNITLVDVDLQKLPRLFLTCLMESPTRERGTLTISYIRVSHLLVHAPLAILPNCAIVVNADREQHTFNVRELPRTLKVLLHLSDTPAENKEIATARKPYFRKLHLFMFPCV